MTPVAIHALLAAIAAASYHPLGTKAFDSVESAWVRRVKRQSPTLDVEATASGLIKRQHRRAGNDDDWKKDKLRCQIAQNKAPDFTKAPLGLDSFENIGDVQACAILCSSNPDCTAFYHVKNQTHPLYKNCILTQWTGDLSKLLLNNCCDAGFPCSSKEIVRTLQSENQILRRRAKKRAKEDASNANRYDELNENQDREIARLKGALKIRQKIMVEKDLKNADAVNAARKESNELNGISTQSKRYESQIAKAMGDGHRLTMENQLLTRREKENSERTAAKAKNYVGRISKQRKDIRRLYKALGIRQKIMVEKDVANAQGKGHENQLSNEVQRLTADVYSLNVLVAQYSLYLRAAGSALTFAIALLLCIAGSAAWQRRAHSFKEKQPRTMTECSNAQLTAQ